MLQIKDISKKYVTGDLVQQALDGVCLNLRDNEFVAVLGPSGSGKTTLLNIIGGLDRYDSGDLIINGISTKRYKDRDWDSYRNHTIGFVFQSYNLIPHQTILSNVELALTISGISRKERRQRARQALEQVGLGDQVHKKPNQMSGGQMQRVAIARALVNDPDILLADEPTGALDTETSVQVMELLKEVAKDRLVVMVTHNPELADTYATRIVKLRDGRITDDSDPYQVDETGLEPPKHKNMGKSSMSLLTALSLSFNNLRTKKARTFLTAFAGSIGIIGIALILSLSTGVNQYITDIQRDTMSSYPISIDAQTVDLSSLIASSPVLNIREELDHDRNGLYSNGMSFEMVSTLTSSITENNLTAFKKYLEDPNSPIHKYIGTNGIVYTYDVQFDVFTFDPNGTFVNTDGSTLDGGMQSSMMENMGVMSEMVPVLNNFDQLLPGQNGVLISPTVTDNYELLSGDWPKKYNEVILVIDQNNEIDAATLYQLGMLPAAEYKELMAKIKNGEEVKLETVFWSYEDICSKEFYLIPACDTYSENEDGTFTYFGDNMTELESRIDSAIKLKVTGVIRPYEDATSAMLVSPFGYTQALTDYLIDYTAESAVVKAQQENKNINVLTGLSFAPEDDAVRVADTKMFLSSMGITEKANMFKTLMQSSGQTIPGMESMGETQMAAALDGWLMTASDQMLLMIYDSYISAGTYEDNMSAFGLVSLDAPSSINIYCDSFENKDFISDCIEDYNKTVSEADKITYTDYVGLLMSSVTTIINVISYVLIAFVSVSLVVSSIMIGIITYISVLERTKEIGILRAIGASKSNISQVFNAETFIVGLLAGLLGIGISLLILIPGNAVIHYFVGNNDVSAILPTSGAILLVVLSVILTLIGGLLPAKKAAHKDPVAALRTE